MEKQIKPIIETSIMISLAFVLELLSEWLQALIPILNTAWLQGGTISLAMLPIILTAYRNGVGHGVVAGFCFGLLNFFLSGGVLYHWGSLIFDYFLAFSVWGLVGLLRKHNQNVLLFILGIIVVGLLRYLLHTISGVIFFSDFAGDKAVWIYSLTYNFGYNFATTILTIVIGLPIQHLFLQKKII